MAEVDKVLDDLKKQGTITEETLSKIKNAFDDSVKSIQDKFSNINISDNINKQLNSLDEQLQTLNNLELNIGTEEFVNKLDEIKKQYGDFVVDMAVEGGKFYLINKMLSAAPTINWQESFSNGVESVSSMGDALNLIKNKIPGIEYFEPFIRAIDVSNNLEQSFLSLKSESGSLNEYLKATDATSFAAQFEAVNSTMGKVAMGTGRTYEQVSKLGSILGKGMPNAMGEFNNVNLSATESINDMEAAIKIAAGTGQDATKVAEYMSKNYQNFGNSTEKAGESSTRAATNFAKMSSVASQMNIGFSKMESIVNNVGDAFLYYADNTQSLVNMIGKLGPAFQAAKLSPEAITQLSKSMVKNLSDMGLAQRAFLSMQAGGSGGLRGGYQVEMLKVQGKFEEIQAMADKALRKQFGGRIVTMEEAAQDEGAARQYTKQVQMLTQGPLKMVEGEGQAKALLDAMAKGDTSGASGIISGQEALNETINRGTEQTEKQTNILNDISVLTKMGATSQALTASLIAEQMKDKLSQNQGLKDIVTGLRQKLGLEDVPLTSKELSQAAAQSEVGKLSAKTPQQKFEDFLSGIQLEKFQEKEAKKSKKKATEPLSMEDNLEGQGYTALADVYKPPVEENKSFVDTLKSFSFDSLSEKMSSFFTPGIQPSVEGAIPSVPMEESNPVLEKMKNFLNSFSPGGAATAPEGGAAAPTESVVTINVKTGENTTEAIKLLIAGTLKEVKQSESSKSSVGFANYPTLS